MHNGIMENEKTCTVCHVLRQLLVDRVHFLRLALRFTCDGSWNRRVTKDYSFSTFNFFHSFISVNVVL